MDASGSASKAKRPLPRDPRPVKGAPPYGGAPMGGGGAPPDGSKLSHSAPQPPAADDRHSGTGVGDSTGQGGDRGSTVSRHASGAAVSHAQAPEQHNASSGSGAKEGSSSSSSRHAAELAMAQQGLEAYAMPEIYSSRYTIAKSIGKGAYGAVYIAKERVPAEPGVGGGAAETTTRKVALKHIVNGFVSATDARRMYREIKVMAHFSHPNIVPLLEVIKPRDAGAFKHIYLISELMETDLHRVIHSRQDLTSDHIAYFMYQTLCALEHIHAAGVLHRDLKPSNLLVNADCSLKMCDFGLARESDSSLSQALTEYVVTRWYRAPEVLLSGGRYTSAIDVWSAGCVLAELLLRRPLFPGENYLHQLQLITQTIGSPSDDDLHFVKAAPARSFMLRLPSCAPIPWSTLMPHVRGPVLDLLSGMLTFDPDKRMTVEEALGHPFLARVRAARKHINEDAVPPARPFKLRVPGGSAALKAMSVEQIKARFFGELCGMPLTPSPTTSPLGPSAGAFGLFGPMPILAPVTAPGTQQAPPHVAPSTGHPLAQGGAGSAGGSRAGGVGAGYGVGGPQPPRGPPPRAGGVGGPGQALGVVGHAHAPGGGGGSSWAPAAPPPGGPPPPRPYGMSGPVYAGVGGAPPATGAADVIVSSPSRVRTQQGRGGTDGQGDVTMSPVAGRPHHRLGASEGDGKRRTLHTDGTFGELSPSDMEDGGLDSGMDMDEGRGGAAGGGMGPLRPAVGMPRGGPLATYGKPPGQGGQPYRPSGLPPGYTMGAVTGMTGGVRHASVVAGEDVDMQSPAGGRGRRGGHDEMDDEGSAFGDSDYDGVEDGDEEEEGEVGGGAAYDRMLMERARASGGGGLVASGGGRLPDRTVHGGGALHAAAVQARGQAAAPAHGSDESMDETEGGGQGGGDVDAATLLFSGTALHTQGVAGGPAVRSYNGIWGRVDEHPLPPRAHVLPVPGQSTATATDAAPARVELSQQPTAASKGAASRAKAAEFLATYQSGGGSFTQSGSTSSLAEGGSGGGGTLAGASSAALAAALLGPSKPAPPGSAATVGGVFLPPGSAAAAAYAQMQRQQGLSSPSRDRPGAALFAAAGGSPPLQRLAGAGGMASPTGVERGGVFSSPVVGAGGAAATAPGSGSGGGLGRSMPSLGGSGRGPVSEEGGLPAASTLPGAPHRGAHSTSVDAAYASANAYLASRVAGGGGGVGSSPPLHHTAPRQSAMAAAGAAALGLIPRTPR